MGKLYEAIDGALRSFIEAQQMFFVASAPAAGGHVNLSPKGLDTLRIIDGRTLVYLDYVGSGAETIAHLNDNGRIVLMVCAFDGPPKIVRLHGRGETIEPQHEQYSRALRSISIRSARTCRHSRICRTHFRLVWLRRAAVPLRGASHATAGVG